MSKGQMSLAIGWLYPELMSTYGDRGNIIALTKRCEWRGIKTKVNRISIGTKKEELTNCELLFMGGAQDTQQEIVNEDLFKKKGDTLKKIVEEGIPGLYICGAYQFLGKYYKTAEGTVLPGLEIFPCYTENPTGQGTGKKVERLTGDIIVQANSSRFTVHGNTKSNKRIIMNEIVGFENHGGRTYLEDPDMKFAKVIKGFGNNGEDKTEGILYKNSIGSYLHGPILPKNPEVADWLIKTSLEKKYGKEFKLEQLDDTLETHAKEAIVKRLTA